jgi:hypothetical protein
MSEDFKDPNVLVGLALAVIFLGTTIAILLVERF